MLSTGPTQVPENSLGMLSFSNGRILITLLPNLLHTKVCSESSSEFPSRP